MGAEHADRYFSNSNPHGNSLEPERRLRLGYVRATSRHQSVGQFFEPVLARHDRREFEASATTIFRIADATTERCSAARIAGVKSLP